MSDPIHIISLGAGVQSSTMSLMAAYGEIKPMPTCAIFADTGDEPKKVYHWLRELTRMLTFPVVWLKGPRLSDAIVNQWGHSQIPAWFSNNEGKPVPGKRQCTKYFKILPIRHEIRQRFSGKDVVLWQGISLDEISRMKDSDRQWLKHRWPLIELRMTRHDCQEYLKRHGLSAPKSACVQCPFRSRAQWKDSLNEPHDMEIVRRVESVILPRKEFLTNQLVPVEQGDFSADEDRGQLNLFNNECEGMCGV